MKENLKPYVSSSGSESDHVLFVERAGELLYVARLRRRAPEPQRERVSNGRRVACSRPETG